MGKLQARIGRELKLYVRQMAWLHATPKPDERTKRAQAAGAATAPPAISRIEQLKRDKIPVLMPPNPAPHIIDRLMEMGITEVAGMGVVALSWQTIDAWARRTCIDIPPWEARLIRQLSVEYVTEGRRAESETAPPPWLAPSTEASVNAELRVLDLVLG